MGSLAMRSGWILTACALSLAGCASRGGGTAARVDTAPREKLALAYRIAMSNPAEHLFEIQIDIGGALGDTLELQLPVWSPGRYARMDFAKNVQDFAVTDGGGKAVGFDKENGSLWRLRPAGAPQLTVKYRVFANNLSGTFSVLDTAHANWNGGSLFMYVVGHKPDPVRLSVAPPAGWHVINGASDQLDQLEFSFPNYDLLIDTPTEVAPAFTVDSFRVDERLYRVVVHHNGPDQGQRERFVHDVEKLVRAENRIIGPPPLQRYTFLFNIGYRGGDGMEHLYSTQIMDPSTWTDTATVLPGVGTAAHEYVHVWNVKRIRPIVLGPFDYTREQYQPSLWVAEGWTQYYGEMNLERSGVIGKSALYDNLAGYIRTTSESPARLQSSARSASFHAPFWDGAPQGMQTNRQYTFLSYYTKGAALAMLLDLQIRSRTEGGKSLDDVLRTLKERTWDAPNVSYYLQGRGYTEGDVEKAASDVAGIDLHDWFERYVGGVEELPWKETIALIGLRLDVSGTGDSQVYRLSEDPAATPAIRALRERWLHGQ